MASLGMLNDYVHAASSGGTTVMHSSPYHRSSQTIQSLED